MFSPRQLLEQLSTTDWSWFLHAVGLQGPFNTLQSASPIRQGLGAFLSLHPPNISISGSISEGRAHGGGYRPSFALAARERHSTFPPRVDTHRCSPGNGGAGARFPSASASALAASGTPRLGKGTSPAQPQPGLQLACGTEPACPPASTQTLQRGMQPRPPHSQTAPIFLQEPSSPLQLAFLEIPLLLATKTLFSLFPCNSRRSMANIFLQAARLSYKTAQAAHTPGAAPAACPHYNWFGFPSGVKSDHTEYYISLRHSRHNVKQTRASEGRRR